MAQDPADHAKATQDTGEKVKAKGLIVGRAGDTMVVRTTKGDMKVQLTDDTKVVQPKGLFKMRKEHLAFTALMPGLKIEAEGTSTSQNQMVAKTVKFSGDDLKRAEAMQAALTPTNQAVAKNAAGIDANKQAIAENQQQIATNRENISANAQQIEQNEKQVDERFASLADYDTKGEATVNFASGSSKISEEDKAELTQLAQSATQQKQYIVEVMGFADSRGSAAMNQKLSMDRAQEVIAFLVQNCRIPPRRIVAPGAMGEASPSAANETASGRAENRKVEVKVLVNRGVVGD
jgi:outer membrane protein OmpA-like peptidoglycan-associated protein